MFRVSLMAACAAFSSGATLTSTCIDSLGIVTVTWSGAAVPVQINVGQPSGPPLTGLLPSSGTLTTGPWVHQGLTFYLVDQSGAIEASATASVQCANTPPMIDQGLASGSYFPLNVGNTWIYKYNDRVVTASYVTQTISSITYANGQIYFVLTDNSAPASTIALLRADSSGVIYQLVNGVDQVYLDPKASQATSYKGALGVFNDSIVPPSTLVGSLIQTTSTYARGIGLVGSRSQLLTGSSGGFTQSLDLVDVKIDSFHLAVPQPKISLSIDNPFPDLTHQKAPNCAIPCYYAACGLGTPVDPPGTYRPCGQARIDASAEVPFFTVLLELLDPTGKPVFQNSFQSFTPSTRNYIRLPLYTGTSPFTILPPGIYSLVGSVNLGSTTLATSTMMVQIQ